jgi:hypothetical protein
MLALVVTMTTPRCGAFATHPEPYPCSGREARLVAALGRTCSLLITGLRVIARYTSDPRRPRKDTRLCSPLFPPGSRSREWPRS